MRVREKASKPSGKMVCSEIEPQASWSGAVTPKSIFSQRRALWRGHFASSSGLVVLLIMLVEPVGIEPAHGRSKVSRVEPSMTPIRNHLHVPSPSPSRVRGVVLLVFYKHVPTFAPV